MTPIRRQPESRVVITGQETQTPMRKDLQGNLVWVNHNSKVYHFPGSRWYRATEDGRLMGEQEAIAAGYHAAENGQ